MQQMKGVITSRGIVYRPKDVPVVTRDEVEQRILLALRIVRNIKMQVGPSRFRSCMPQWCYDWEDYTAAQTPDGQLVSRDDYSYQAAHLGAPEEDPGKEMFHVRPRDIDQADVALKWFAALDRRKASQKPGMELYAPMKSMTKQQRVVWLRSYAYERPLSFDYIGRRIGLGGERCRVRYHEAMEFCTKLANGRA